MKQPKQENPLVSIIVITYNSAKYVFETLESTKAQTYQNIELIVSDDCSTDNTVEICKNWIKKNKERFVRVELITIKENTGIPANCNRGLYSANGIWLKYIAGDDILDEYCIDYYVDFEREHSNVKVIISDFKSFSKDILDGNKFNLKKNGYKKFYSLTTTAHQQFRKLLRRNFFHGPTIFVKRSLLIFLGGYDEKYLFEDLPMALKITSKGVKLYFLDRITVYYRIGIHSITNNRSETNLFSDFYKYKYKFEKDYIFSNANLFIVLCKKYEYYRLLYMDKLGLNKNSLFSRIIHKITYLINPLNIYNKYF